MHRRQYLPDARVSYADLLRWRSHAVKFSRHMSAQLENAMEFAVVSRRGTTSHQRNRVFIAQLIASRIFFARWAVWIGIALRRMVHQFLQWRARQQSSRARKLSPASA